MKSNLMRARCKILLATFMAIHLSLNCIHNKSLSNSEKNELVEELITAAGIKGNLYKVVHLIKEEGAPIDGNKKYCPLITAASWDRKEIVKVLLKNGAQPNKRDEDGDTALHHVSHWGCVNYPIAKELVKYGASVNIDNGYGETPLRLATKAGNLDIVRLFLNNGAKKKSILHALPYVSDAYYESLNPEYIRPSHSDLVHKDLKVFNALKNQLYWLDARKQNYKHFAFE